VNCKATAPSSAAPPIHLSHLRIQPRRVPDWMRQERPLFQSPNSGAAFPKRRRSLGRRGSLLSFTYKVFFPSAFTFAHLALAIAASLAFTAALIRRSAFLAAFGVA